MTHDLRSVVAQTFFKKLGCIVVIGFYFQQFAQHVYRAYFIDNCDIGNAEVIVDIAQGAGIDRNSFAANVQSESVKERFKSENDRAIVRKVFGSPYFIVDDEPFWGADRMEQLEHWLKNGGF